MCGIAGWLGAVSDSRESAARIARALRHRGPDAHGIQSWSEATLVHTRLSILDLSPTGAQPIANEDGTVWAVFNGEIYNHRALRQSLEKRGHVFGGRSDSEILPHLYEEEGSAFVSKLRGMFALAIYDTRTRTLTLARDRFGIKPLFYAVPKDRFVFASEISALLGFPGIDDRPDSQSIYDLATLFYIPAPETFYIGIRAVEPGEIVEARIDPSAGISWQSRSYHQWVIAPNLELTLTDAAERVDELVTAAVSRQLESDVPLGALLSGGIDSSLVSSAAQTAMEHALQTFNVRFADKDFDETWAALAVAKHIGSNHQTLDIGGDGGTWDYITGMLLHAGQPYADTSLFAANSICRLMRQHVTVALSGDGGDEAFGGYSLYWRIRRIARFQRLPQQIWSAAAAILPGLVQFGLAPQHMPSRLLELARADDTAVVQGMFCQLPEGLHSRLCRDTKLLPVRRLFEPQWEYELPPRAARLESLAAHATEVNTRLHLPNDFLFKVDTASMKESLEVRVPMLDEELFAFGLALPYDLKVQGRTGKRVLREVAQRRLPAEVANKPKRGFAIPVDSWVDGDFKARVKAVLLGSSSQLPQFFRPEVYSPIVDAFCGGQPYQCLSRQVHSRLVIMLLSVQLVLDRTSRRPVTL